MKWVILAGMLGWPVVAGAQTGNDQIDGYEAKMQDLIVAAAAGRTAAACGFRTDGWSNNLLLALSDDAMAMARTLWPGPNNGFSEIGGVECKKELAAILEAFGESGSVSAQDCSALASSSHLEDLDSIANSANLPRKGDN
jgi:hypothetical protein